MGQGSGCGCGEPSVQKGEVKEPQRKRDEAIQEPERSSIADELLAEISKGTMGSDYFMREDLVAGTEVVGTFMGRVSMTTPSPLESVIGQETKVPASGPMGGVHPRLRESRCGRFPRKITAGQNSEGEISPGGWETGKKETLKTQDSLSPAI